MYQGMQTGFDAGENVTCEGSIAIGEAWGIVCYARADGELICDGTIVGQTFTPDTARRYLQCGPGARPLFQCYLRD